MAHFWPQDLEIRIPRTVWIWRAERMMKQTSENTGVLIKGFKKFCDLKVR